MIILEAVVFDAVELCCVMLTVVSIIFLPHLFS